MVSIHRPLGYGPSTLPLRHAALPSGSGYNEDISLFRGRENVKNTDEKVIARKKNRPIRDLNP